MAIFIIYLFNVRLGHIFLNHLIKLRFLYCSYIMKEIVIFSLRIGSNSDIYHFLFNVRVGHIFLNHLIKMRFLYCSYIMKEIVISSLRIGSNSDFYHFLI